MTQRDRVLRLLRERGDTGLNTTDLMAPNVADGGSPVTRLAARIFELQREGYGITTARKLNGTATYTLVKDVEYGQSVVEQTGPVGRREDTSPLAADVGEGGAPMSLFEPEPPAPLNAAEADWEAA